MTEATLDKAAAAIRAIDRRRWLDDGVAADIVFTGEIESRRVALEAAFADEPFDIIVQHLARREERLLVADMDLPSSVRNASTNSRPAPARRPRRGHHRMGDARRDRV